MVYSLMWQPRFSRVWNPEKKQVFVTGTIRRILCHGGTGSVPMKKEYQAARFRSTIQASAILATAASNPGALDFAGPAAGTSVVE